MPGPVEEKARLADLQSKSIGLVWGLVANRRLVCIH